MNNCLITGGTGTFGVSYICTAIENKWHRRIISYSRDELKQVSVFKFLKNKYGDSVKGFNEPAGLEINGVSIRFVIGDVLDFDRLMVAMRNIDIVIHAAALKHVPVCEYNPIEATKININGSVNVVRAAGLSGVKDAIALSTDKAVDPINIYGASKLCLEKVFLGGNAYFHDSTKFRVVRYGNIMGSRGSIISLLVSDVTDIYITDPEMTRFWLSIDDAVGLVRHSQMASHGGEVFVPILKSLKMGNLFSYLRPHMKQNIIGPRPGEKKHEKMIAEYDLSHTRVVDGVGSSGLDKVYVITSLKNDSKYTDNPLCSLQEYTSNSVEFFKKEEFITKLDSSIINNICSAYSYSN